MATVPAFAEPYESTVRGAASQSFVTVIDAETPSARVASVADLVEREAGVSVRSRGGLGAFSSVSIRGSEANQVQVMVDGVPLTRAAAGTIDLSQLPASGLTRIEIYRGVPPPELGSEAIGGVINLITRKGTRSPGWRLSAGGGDFGARSLSAGWGGTRGGVGSDVSAAYQGADGDFLYYDTAGTLATQLDDRATRRQNNGFDQGALDLSLSFGHKVRATVGAHGFLKRQGVPGPGLAGAETRLARLTTGRLLLDGGLTGARGILDWQANAHLLYERTSFENPAGEQAGPFGPNVSEGEALVGGLHGRVRLRWGRAQVWTLPAEARVEQRWPYNLLITEKAGGASLRVIGAVGVADDVRLLGGRLAFTPALRLDGAFSRIAATDAPARDSTDVFVSPRLTVRAELAKWLALRGSAGRFVRFPSLLELFGDGAFVMNRPFLRPESAWGGDFGGTLALGSRWGRLSLEAAFFGRQVTDTIAFVAARVVAAENLGETRMLGAEVRFDAELWRTLRARLDYTFLDATRVDSGRMLPGRAPHELHLRVELRRAPFNVFYELDYLDRTFRDAENLTYVPERALHALGASFEHGRFLFSFEVRNLADLRTLEIPLGSAGRTTPIPLIDFFNYPLPGRALYATLTVRS